MTATTRRITRQTPLLVALDIDGTTIDHTGGLSPAVREAVADVVAAGHHLVISTGRSIVATLPIIRLLDLERGYVVCSNGAVTLTLDPNQPRGYRVIDTVTFDPRPVLTMLREQIPDALVAVEDIGVGFKVSAPFPEGELGGEQVVVDWEELLAYPATRVTLRRPDASSEEFLEQVERAGLHEVSYAVGWTAWLDINPEGVSKGSALELVRRHLRGGAGPDRRGRRPAQRHRDAALGGSRRGHGPGAGRGQGGRRRGDRHRRGRRPGPGPAVPALRRSATVPDLLITSPANPRLRSLVALRRRRIREDSGTTLVEGYEELSLALASGVCPQTLFVCPELFSPAGQAGRQEIGRQEDLVAHARRLGAEVVILSRPAFDKVAYREGPDGLLAVVPSVGRALSTIDPDDDALLLVAQGVEKPGNLGAMLRTADAAGVGAVVAADPVTDWGNPNVVRASKGTVFAVPVAAATTTETLAWLAARHVRLVVTTPETDLLYTDADLTGAVAVAVGAEKHGADDALLDAAAYRVRIPMHGKANSLNVAAAAAIVLFEARRQRTPSTAS